MIKVPGVLLRMCIGRFEPDVFRVLGGIPPDPDLPKKASALRLDPSESSMCNDVLSRPSVETYDFLIFDSLSLLKSTDSLEMRGEKGPGSCITTEYKSVPI